MSTPETPQPEKTPKASKAGEYEVGNCKPPKEHQFQKGNKQGKGRKKGSKATRTIVKEALGQKVATKLGGKTKMFSKFELSLHQLANKASGGDLKAIEKVIALQERYGPPEDPEEPSPEKLRLDQATLRDHLTYLDMLYPPQQLEGRDDGDA